jgi:uncharacterized membrane protein
MLKSNLSLSFLSLSLFGVFLLLTRVYWTHSFTYSFLFWNLFLAYIPLFISYLVVKIGNRNSWLFFTGTGIWLLFFPNCHYILTDLFHLHQRPFIPIWFDLLLILTFAWTGLLLGFQSLVNIELALAKKFSNLIARICAIFFLFMASFGIYLGRFQRWNSWDILCQPFSLIKEIAHRFIHPEMHPRTWAVTFFLGFLLCLMYFSLKPFSEKWKPVVL